jgi:hypothetical protein
LSADLAARDEANAEPRGEFSAETLDCRASAKIKIVHGMHHNWNLRPKRRSQAIAKRAQVSVENIGPPTTHEARTREQRPWIDAELLAEMIQWHFGRQQLTGEWRLAAVEQRRNSYFQSPSSQPDRKVSGHPFSPTDE